MVKKITIMIQARTGSKRFPKKVLAKIEKKSMIWHVINRVKGVKGVDQVILVTTRKKEDNILLKIAKESNIIGFVGSTHDVLERYYKCALKYNADPIIRITGDCPLVDPYIIEKMLRFYVKHNYDYASNTQPPTYPDGLDTEIFSFKTLEKVHHNAKLRSDREHVTSYIRKNLKKFKIFNYENHHDLSNLRWTVDEKQDLKFVKKIYAEMRPKLIFPMKSVMKIITKDPKIVEVNKGIRRNEGYFLSLKEDKRIK